MFDKMKQLMEVKKQADQLKRELENLTVEINEVNGIKLSINGAQKFQSIEIENSLLERGNKEKLEMDLLNSVNVAIKKSQNLAAQKMTQMTGLNIPGF